MKFRNLKEEEIDVRISQFTPKGAFLLLYKDARVDMDILDETVGALNWQRKHTRDNANCTIEIYDEKKGQWIGKEDTGTESNTEKQKGLASDSFKRAGFNWGIGRELYTSPQIFVFKEKINISLNKQGKETTYDKFIVSQIKTVDKKIKELEITNATTGESVYKMAKPKTKTEIIKEIQNKYTLVELAELMNCEEEKVKEKLERQTLKTLQSLEERR